MTGLIFDIRRFSVHDGPGIRTTVFMKGCPLSCWWCHNPESKLPACETFEESRMFDGQEFRQMRTIGKEMPVAEVMEEIEKDLVFMNESGGGVTFSGGEPLFQPQFLEETLRECRRKDIHTTLDTSGYASRETIERILPYTSLFLYDIKHMDDELHKRYMNQSNSPILENLRFISERGGQVIIRFPVVEKINDHRENLDQLSLFLKSLPNPVKEIDLLPYHRIGNGKYAKFGKENLLGSMPDYPKERLQEIGDFFKGQGFAVKTGG